MGLLKELFKPLINNRKGIEGEKRVSTNINPLLFGRVYHKEIDNLIIIDDNGKSH